MVISRASSLLGRPAGPHKGAKCPQRTPGHRHTGRRWYRQRCKGRPLAAHRSTLSWCQSRGTCTRVSHPGSSTVDARGGSSLKVHSSPGPGGPSRSAHTPSLQEMASVTKSECRVVADAGGNHPRRATHYWPMSMQVVPSQQVCSNSGRHSSPRTPGTFSAAHTLLLHMRDGPPAGARCGCANTGFGKGSTTVPLTWRVHTAGRRAPSRRCRCPILASPSPGCRAQRPHRTSS